MAKPIKITPILKGKDAVKFLSKLKENRSFESKSSSKLNEVRKDSALFKSKIKKA